MRENKKQNGFIVQAGILAAAGFLSRIIGILYRSPLTAVIGDEGNGYYSAAYYIYAIVLLISSYSIPSAISKVIAAKLALKEYNNAHRIFRCAFLYVIIVGGISSVLTFIFAEVLVIQGAAQVLRIFTPTIFLSGILGVFRGYFQAYGTMIPTSVSQIIEQIVNAVISVTSAIAFISMAGVSGGTGKAVYGASGSAVGTGAGVLTALVFMTVLYLINRGQILKRVKKDRHETVDSVPDIFKVIIGMVTPIIISTFIYNSTNVVNQTIFTRILQFVKHVPEAQIASEYGIFAGKAVVITNIPIAMASAMSAAVIPSISASHAKKEKKAVRKKIAAATRVTMLIAIPSSMGLMMLSRPITQLLFPQKESLEQAATMLTVLGITVMLYSLSTLSNAVLQAVGRVGKPMFNAFKALVIQTACLIPMVLYTELNLYALAFAAIIYSLSMCILNAMSVKQVLKYRQEIKKTFVIPFLASVFMGACTYGTYTGIYILTGINVVSLGIALAVAALTYFVSVCALGGAGEAELMRLPGGRRLVAAAKKCYLIRDERESEEE